MNFRNILGFAFGPIAGAALGLISVPVTAWVFAPEDIGRLNVLQIALSFALLLTVLGLDQAYVREYHEAKNKPQLLYACFLPGFVFLLLLGLPSIFFAKQLAQKLYADANPWLYVATLFGFFIGYINRFLSLILRVQERGWAYSVSQVLPKITHLALIIGVALAPFHKEFIHLLLIALLAQILVAVIYAWNTRISWWAAMHSQIDTLQIKALLKFGLPLIFSGLAYWGLTATSTIALRSWSTLQELAIYSVANSFAAAAIVFQSIFSVVWAPTVYKWVSQGVDMTLVDKIAKQALAVVCFIVALCGSLAWICDWLLPPSYVQVKYVLLCMLMQPLLYTLSEITSVGIGIQRRTLYTVWITGAAFLGNLALSFYLVPLMGASGAAIANASAFTVFFIARTEVSARIWRSFPRAQLYASVFVLLTLAVASVHGAVLAPIALHGVWLVLLALSVFLFREQWRSVVQTLKQKVALLHG